MRRIAVLASLGLLAACSPKLPETIDSAVLADAVGRAIGDPSTCVMMADTSGRVVWQAGSYITCSRQLPTCSGAATSDVKAALKAAIGKPERFASCASTPDGLRTVGWAIGPVPTSAGKPPAGLTYVALMEGERALPGREIQSRVENAFAKAGF